MQLCAMQANRTPDLKSASNARYISDLNPVYFSFQDTTVLGSVLKTSGSSTESRKLTKSRHPSHQIRSLLRSKSPTACVALTEAQLSYCVILVSLCRYSSRLKT